MTCPTPIASPAAAAAGARGGPGPPHRLPHHGADLRHRGRIRRPLRGRAVSHWPHQQRRILPAAEDRHRRRRVDGEDSLAAARPGLLAWWNRATPNCSPWSAIAARRKTFIPPPTTRPTCGIGPMGGSAESAHGRADRRAATSTGLRAAGCAISRRAIRWSPGCAAFAWFPNPRSATGWHSRS